MFRAALLGSFLIQVVSTSTSYAGGNELIISNETDLTMTELYVKSSAKSDWLVVLRSGESLSSGYNFTIDVIPEEDGCLFDVRARFDDNSERVVTGFDNCRTLDPGDENDLGVVAFYDRQPIDVTAAA